MGDFLCSLRVACRYKRSKLVSRNLSSSSNVEAITDAPLPDIILQGVDGSQRASFVANAVPLAGSRAYYNRGVVRVVANPTPASTSIALLILLGRNMAGASGRGAVW